MSESGESLLGAKVYELWELKGTFKKLYGEVDLNFQLTTSQGKYILKLHPETKIHAHLEFQNDLLDFLENKDLPFQLPRVVRSMQNNRMERMEIEGTEYACRILTWVDGELWSEQNYISPDLYFDLGKMDGILTMATSEFNSSNGSQDHRWTPSNAEWIEDHMKIFGENQLPLIRRQLDIIKSTLNQFKSSLRSSVLYMDANDYNILVKKNKINGFIDFGDAQYTYTINELAVTIAYGAMNEPDPLSVSRKIVAGFHSVYPLREEELAVLYSLVAARLMISVTFSSLRKDQVEDNSYLGISEAPAWDLLEKWNRISPAKATAAFRSECGLEPVPGESEFVELLKKQSFKFVLGDKFLKEPHYLLDLGVGSTDLGNNSEFDSHEKFETKLERMLADQKAAFAIGGYLEVRSVYVDDRFMEEGNNGSRWRTVHLGQDLWVPAHTQLYAPMDAEVFVSVNNEGPGNYGPTIILKHQLNNHTFYTLYGHLSMDSIVKTKVGDRIKGGDNFASVGDVEVNGGWVPHLHLQIIREMWSDDGDFQGVSYFNEKEILASVCPDPSLITGIEEYRDVSNPKSLVAQRESALGKNLSVSYNEPLLMLRGFGPYLYDHTGRRYLDTVNNVAHVGHEHPRIVKRIRDQAGVLNTNTRYLHEHIVSFARELTDKFPDPLSVCYFVNSGSEANELALRIARTVTTRSKMLAFEMGYHGNTAACIEVSSYKFGRGGFGQPENTSLLSSPDPFRDPSINSNYSTEIESKVTQEFAGFIGESILSCAGQIVPPAGYFADLYKNIRANGGLCIADEVQVGFGRVGETYWGFELHGVIPDIVTIGKPMGNGHPLAAVVTTREIADAFANGMEYFNTFGGNPVSCAVGREVLSIIDEEQLQVNARERGAELTNGLQDLQKQNPIIADIRGSGLFLGFELMKSGQIPATESASYLVNRMRDRGILMSSDGPDENVIKIKPPLCISQRDVDHILSQLAVILREAPLQQ